MITFIPHLCVSMISRHEQPGAGTLGRLQHVDGIADDVDTGDGGCSGSGNDGGGEDADAVPGLGHARRPVVIGIGRPLVEP